MRQQRKSEGSRINLIQAVQTPLGFFVLAVLIVEAITGILTGISDGVDRTSIIYGNLGVIVFLVLIVSIMAILRPEALYGGRPNAVNQPAPEDTGTDIKPGESRPPFESIVDDETPVVVSVDPAIGSLVDAKKTTFHVTFSKPMRKGWSFVQAVQGDFPEVSGQPIISDDGKTITASVALRPGRTYAFWLNSARYRSFSGRNGKAAVPYFVYFRTLEDDTGCNIHTDCADFSH